MYTGEVVGGWNRFWSQVNSTHTLLSLLAFRRVASVSTLPGFMSPQRGSDVSLLRPWRPGWKRFTPAVTQDLQQMRLIMFLENLAPRTKTHWSPASPAAQLYGESGMLQSAGWTVTLVVIVLPTTVCCVASPFSSTCSLNWLMASLAAAPGSSKQQMSAQSARIPLRCLSAESIGCGKKWAAVEFLRFSFQGMCTNYLHLCNITSVVHSRSR